MANYSSPAAAADTLACTDDEAALISAALEQQNDLDDASGFQFNWWPDDPKVDRTKGQGFLCAEEYADPDHIPELARQLIGQLLVRAKASYLMVGVAQYCDKMRINSFGGYYFKIMADGRMVKPQIHWPDELGERAADSVLDAPRT